MFTYIGENYLFNNNSGMTSIHLDVIGDADIQSQPAQVSSCQSAQVSHF